MCFHLITSVGQRKNSESPWGIEPRTFRIPRSDALPVSHRDSRVSKAHCEVQIWLRILDKSWRFVCPNLASGFHRSQTNAIEAKRTQRLRQLTRKELSRSDERCIIWVTERSIMKHVIVTRRSCVYAEVGGGVVVTLGSRCREVWIDK